MHQHRLHYQSAISREDCRTYAAEQLAYIANGTGPLNEIQTKRSKKYWKVIQPESKQPSGYSDASVVAFISFKAKYLNLLHGDTSKKRTL